MAAPVGWVGVVVKPRFAAGTTDVVVGYNAALKTGDGQPLQFYGGGQLGRDLTLPRVREVWPEPLVDAADDAAAEWQAAFRGRSTGVTGREVRPLRTGEPEGGARNLTAFVARLEQTPVTDRAVWSDAARDTAGASSTARSTRPATPQTARSATSNTIGNEQVA